MGVRVRALGGMLVVVGVPVVAIVMLHGLAGAEWHRVDWSDPIRWLGTVPLDVALVAIARLVALAGAYAVVATSVAHLAAVATRNRSLMRLTARMTVPAVRRLVDRVVAGSVAMSVLAGPAIAAPPAHHPAPVVTHRVEDPATVAVDPLAPLVPEGYAPDPYRIKPVEVPDTPEDRPVTPPAGRSLGGDDDPKDPAREDSGDLGADAVEDRVPAGEATTVTVRRGDSIWKLAEDRLREHLGRPAADPEVAPYWVATVEANAGRLRSGDPDLIFPGERIALPDPAGFTPRGT